ncbi:lysoplasmalogenase family protein [Qipengyuania sp.]|uniref:lysoplasmalogenase family protein n=1 Tax=Qipengyuania sp. TaxID=2004515 RepID=UPI003BAAC6BD
MPHAALAKHRPWLLASLVAGVSYFFVSDDPIGGVWLMLWKGAGVAFLAIYAAFRGHGLDGLLIAGVLTFGALGDVALEVSFLIGGAFFALGHLVAIALYLRNRRSRASGSQTMTALCLLLLTPLIAGLMTYPLDNWLLATAYSGLVGAMAAAAWTSRFPRYQVGVGAVLFVVSDLLIFAREATALPKAITGWLIWPLYFGGQFLIAVGVVQTLRMDRNRIPA